MISIIVVSLNTPKKFLSTINSVLNQTSKNYELIVVDGGSKDETKELINKFNKFINKKIIEKDDGIYDAMNKGISLASHEWIIFLNSGDIFYEKNSLEKIEQTIINSQNYDIIVGNSSINRENFLYLSKRKKINDRSLISCFSHQSTLTKTNLLKENNFNISFKYAADFDFFLKMFKKKKNFLYVDQVISINLPDGISDTDRVAVIHEFKKVFTKYNKNKIINLYYSFIMSYIYLIKFFKIIFPKFFFQKLQKIKYLNKKIRN